MIGLQYLHCPERQGLETSGLKNCKATFIWKFLKIVGVLHFFFFVNRLVPQDKHFCCCEPAYSRLVLSLLCIVAELVGGGSVAVAVAVIDR